MTIEKLPKGTPDITKQNIARLAELFPECVTEGSSGTASDRDEPVLDFDLLKQALSDHLVDGPQERYRLDWPGKREALLTANAPIDKTLRPLRRESVNFDTTRNLFIEGDNLDALKLLQETYLGTVKMIYIDPPYNTGRDFVYRDNFAKVRAKYEAESGQRSETGQRLVANPETSGRFHSDWLSMLFPRLKLARNLLRDDGVIFISIDDVEFHGLKKMCDEIFGENNHVASIIWQKKYAPQNDAKYLSDSHEYLLMYARDKARFEIGLLPRTDEANARYKNPDNDPRGPWKSSDLTRQEYRARDDYEIVNPANGRGFSPPAGNSWGRPRETVKELIQDNRIWFGPDGNSVPSIKRFLSEVKQGITPQTIWYRDDVGDTQEGKKVVKNIFGNSAIFETCKPPRLIMRAMLVSAVAEGDIVLDFFAGSGTTAHAAMQFAREQGRKLKVISVQLPEETGDESEARKAGYTTIAELSRDRIRKAGQSLVTELSSGCGIDVGFRTFLVDSANFQDNRILASEASQEALTGMISHIKDDRTDEDLLFGALLRWGVDITLPVRKRDLAGRTVWFVDPPSRGEEGTSVIACFARPQNGKGGIDTDLADAIAALKPLRVLFRDDGFASDAAKENVASRFKQLAPDTTLRVL